MTKTKCAACANWHPNPPTGTTFGACAAAPGAGETLYYHTCPQFAPQPAPPQPRRADNTIAKLAAYSALKAPAPRRR